MGEVWRRGEEGVCGDVSNKYSIRIPITPGCCQIGVKKSLKVVELGPCPTAKARSFFSFAFEVVCDEAL